MIWPRDFIAGNLIRSKIYHMLGDTFTHLLASHSDPHPILSTVKFTLSDLFTVLVILPEHVHVFIL